jgi:hypothetical protein
VTCGDPVGCACPSAWWGVVPPPCPVHNPSPFGACVTRTLTWPPLGPPLPPLDGPRLTDDDVERIARRVAALLGPRRPDVFAAVGTPDTPTPQGKGDDA